MEIINRPLPKIEAAMFKDAFASAKLSAESAGNKNRPFSGDYAEIKRDLPGHLAKLKLLWRKRIG
jgi:hypothetical protein